jgi:hypothetical protein
MANIRRRTNKSQLEENESSSSNLFSETFKLNIIRRNIEKFLEKWNRERLKKLEVTQQFEKREKAISYFRWTNRAVAIGASVLSLSGRPKIGGGVGLFCSLAEVIFSALREKNEAKKREWGEFLKDCEKLGDNLDELKLIIESLRGSLAGELTNHLKELGTKIYDFLKEHDKNNDGRIDVSELKIDKFARNLKKDWEGSEDKNERTSLGSRSGKKKTLREIAQLMRKFQEIINHRYNCDTN